MIAILTNDRDFALEKLKAEGSLKEYHKGKNLGVFTSDREFFIATRPEQLHGATVSDYRVIGRQDENIFNMIEVARSRMR